MKFLCDNCRAKYQIPDEKIAGRTLRMKCRKCTHDIIIRGQRQSPRRPSTSPGRRVSRRPGSALGAEFRRTVGSAPNTMPKSSPPSNRPKAQWHVSVNDVPIGPIRREEVARKIGMGAISGESLVWREGFDDWRPLKKVTELSSLLEQRRVPSPPTGRSSVAPPRAPRPPPAPRPSIGAKRRSNVIPIGGRHGGAAAEPAVAAGAALLKEDHTEPSMMDLPIADVSEAALPIAAPESSGLSEVSSPLLTPPVDGAAAGAVVPEPQVVVAEPPPRRRVPLPLLFFGLAVMAFGGVLAVLFFNKMMRDEPAPIIASSDIGEETATEMQFDDLDDPETYEPEEIPTENPKAGSSTAANSKKRGTSSKSTTGSSSTKTKLPVDDGKPKLTAAEQAMLDRMGTDSGGGPTNLGNLGQTKTRKGSKPLGGKDVAKVVSKHKKSLQRCYDRAIRGQGEPPSVRMDVRIKVSASGKVTKATATPQGGSDFGGLKRCLETSVKRWGFPPSTEGGETRFPVVFSGN